MPRLTVAVLVESDPGPADLWLLRALSATGCELYAVRGKAPPPLPWSRRASLALMSRGPVRGAARLAADALAARLARAEAALLEDYFDAPALRAWAREALDTRSPEALAELAPDLIVRASGPAMEPRVRGLARLAALDVRHGRAPLAAPDAWAAHWAVLESRADWIGASVRLLDGAAGPAPDLWRGAPQLAPGDATADLFFRSHVMVSDALARLACAYAEGRRPEPWAPLEDEAPCRRGEPGLADLLRLALLDRGRNAPILLKRGFECC